MRNPSGPGPIALVGSGEFLPQMAAVDRHLLEGRPARAAFLPTAAGEEGPDSIHRWLQLGTKHYESLGIEPVPVPVITHADANNTELVARLAGVGLIYLSGGNPGYLAQTLRGSAMWDAIVAAWKNGAALAGCSAGAMALTMQAPVVRGGRPAQHPGLGLLNHLAVLPHFDRMAQWDPGFLDRARQQLQVGVTLVGIDEDTALVGGPHQWKVFGRQRVSVLAETTNSYAHGESVTLS
jgi:cyanophycinase